MNAPKQLLSESFVLITTEDPHARLLPAFGRASTGALLGERPVAVVGVSQIKSVSHPSAAGRVICQLKGEEEV